MNKFRDLFTASTAISTLAAQSDVDMTTVTAGELIAHGLNRCKAIKLSQISLTEFKQPCHQGVKKFKTMEGHSTTAPTGESDDLEAADAVTHTIVDSATAYQDGKHAATEFLAQSFPCDKPDFFVSHSMHDDPSTKWDALKEIAERFQQEYGREPTFWIDKYCVDQRNVAEQLRYLPVFVMCCDRVLVLSGETYFTRLWCCWELFVYSLMYPTLDKLVFWSLDSGAKMRARAFCIENFKVQDVNCFMESDKVAIMAAIESFKGGIDGFDNCIQAFGRKMSARYA